jgi:hypothetical protein
VQRNSSPEKKNEELLVRFFTLLGVFCGKHTKHLEEPLKPKAFTNK